MRKVLSSPAIQFKGSGWYVTDYAKKSGPAGTDKPAAAEKKEPAKKDGKSTSTESGVFDISPAQRYNDADKLLVMPTGSATPCSLPSSASAAPDDVGTLGRQPGSALSGRTVVSRASSPSLKTAGSKPSVPPPRA
jgi:hypothetical protein